LTRISVPAAIIPRSTSLCPSARYRIDSLTVVMFLYGDAHRHADSLVLDRLMSDELTPMLKIIKFIPKQGT